MYYRMLATYVIDADIERALYLDPDILIILSLIHIFMPVIDEVIVELPEEGAITVHIMDGLLDL